MNNLVSILILNWNRKQETSRAIESAISQTHPNVEIVVVDNGSTDGSFEYLKKHFANIRLIQLDKNYGCPGGRNRGIPFCKGDYIFFCDNDGILHHKAVEHALRIIQTNENCVVVSGLVKEFNFQNEVDTDYKIPKILVNKSGLFQGGASLHKKSMYNEIGLYPDSYMYGGEESYLSLKILDHGYEILSSNSVVLWHKRSNHARKPQEEAVRILENSLINAWQLFPIEYFLIYFSFTIFVYPFYAYKKGILALFLKKLGVIYFTFKKYPRVPVKRTTYRKFRKLIS